MLIVYRGLPASGKTSEARKLGLTRVNRDDMRTALHGGFIGTDEAEFEVSAAQVGAVEALLAARVTVVIDDCNLFTGALDYWYALARKHHHQFIIYDLTDVDVEECVRRAADRGEGEAGESVIRSMHARYFPLPPLDESLTRHIRSVPSPLSEEIKMSQGQGYSGEHEAAEVETPEVAADAENAPETGTPADETSTGNELL